ncbi:hypothetical protein DRQ25_01700 [Candidatus Fermentibacteria bacterium]|nr:MAG: hypothetical protein DRQ25_01700 [Candidatus Fermentibacteria bacterium]
MLKRLWAWIKSLFGIKEPLDLQFEGSFEVDSLPESVIQEGGTSMKKALIAGINNYPDAPLRGCVNDCLLMYKVLSEKFGFNTKNIDLLTDSDCTKANLLVSLKKLVTGVKAGDTVFFHYSGHGSQVMSNDWTNSDEADGRDEILCPVDLDWNDPLRDHELGAFFKLLPKGVKILVILDCCHSGTGLRNSLKKLGGKDKDDFRNRFLPPPPSNILTNPRVGLDDNLNFVVPEGKSVQTQKRGFAVSAQKQGDAILISGCMENQTSADAWINGRYHGALSYYLVEVLASHNFDVDYKTLINGVNLKLKNKRFTQVPQLEAKEEFFNHKFLT